MNGSDDEKSEKKAEQSKEPTHDEGGDELKPGGGKKSEQERFSDHDT